MIKSGKRVRPVARRLREKSELRWERDREHGEAERRGDVGGKGRQQKKKETLSRRSHNDAGDRKPELCHFLEHFREPRVYMGNVTRSDHGLYSENQGGTQNHHR